MIYRSAHLTDSGFTLTLTAEGGETTAVSLFEVEKLGVEITDDIFVTLHYLDSREPQKYQVHEINAEWKDWQTRFKLRNEL